MMRQIFLGYVSAGLLLCGFAFAKPISLTDEAETLNPLSAPQVTHGLEIPLRVLGLEPINFGPFGEENLYANQESESEIVEIKPTHTITPVTCVLPPAPIELTLARMQPPTSTTTTP